MVLLLNASDVALNPGPQAELSHSDTETAYTGWPKNGSGHHYFCMP